MDPILIVIYFRLQYRLQFFNCASRDHQDIEPEEILTKKLRSTILIDEYIHLSGLDPYSCIFVVVLIPIFQLLHQDRNILRIALLMINCLLLIFSLLYCHLLITHQDRAREILADPRYQFVQNQWMELLILNQSLIAF